MDTNRTEENVNSINKRKNISLVVRTWSKRIAFDLLGSLCHYRSLHREFTAFLCRLLCKALSMKKGLMQWSDDDDEDSSEESSSSSASDSNADNSEIRKKKRKRKKTIARFAKKDKKAFDYESLQQHGYKAVALRDIPAPVEKQDWSWTTGKDKQRVEEGKESFSEREATRAAAVTGGETIQNAQLRGDKKNLSFSQKEKKKRDLGQASRGKNYVEEEKRQLRESGVYSGFDS